VKSHVKSKSPPDALATRERILLLLRQGPATVDELASSVGVTPNSIRVQLASLERDRLVRREGLRRRFRKPAYLYELSAEAERSFSKAYVPFLTSLLQVLGDRLRPDAMADVLKELGRRVAASQPRHSAGREERIADAIELLGELGAIAEVERRDDTILIRGLGCPLGEVVRRDARVCCAMQSLLAEMTGSTVRATCEHGDRPACRFEIDVPGDAA